MIRDSIVVFPAPLVPTSAYCFARFNFKIDVVQCLCVGAVGKTHVAECDPAAAFAKHLRVGRVWIAGLSSISSKIWVV